jgi:tRNA pseudouridine32 synthase/23S rRNA pseudouridine746 synthase/23S rRNA pseudouridine955/2504/2580 synthase
VTTLRILEQRDGLVAIDKPPGLLVIPGRQPSEPCARVRLEAQLKTKIWVCHRIDRDTSGIVLFATTAEAHRRASMAFESGEVKKTYLAIAEGVVSAPLEIDLPLIEGRKAKMRAAFPGEDGKASKTLVRPLQALRGATLVECEPLTGRQHQIRVHLKSKGHPLLFDHQYGRKEPLVIGDVKLERTPLHAARVDWAGWTITSPLPADLAAVVEALRV